MGHRLSSVSFALLGSIGILGCGGSSTQPASVGDVETPTTDTSSDTSQPTIQTEATLAVYKQWENALEKRDYERVASFYAAGATLQTGNNPQQITGGEQIAKTFKD